MLKRGRENDCPIHTSMWQPMGRGKYF